MASLNILEELRTKKEVKDYFKQLGKEITEEEIDALKQNYGKAQESNGALTLDQLSNVAGGNFIHICDGNIVYKENEKLFINASMGSYNVYNEYQWGEPFYIPKKLYLLSSRKSQDSVHFHSYKDGKIRDLQLPDGVSDITDLHDFSNRIDVTAIYINSGDADADFVDLFSSGDVYFVPNESVDEFLSTRVNK